MGERRQRTRYDSPDHSTDDQIRFLKQQIRDQDHQIRVQDAQMHEQGAQIRHQDYQIGNLKHKKNEL